MSDTFWTIYRGYDCQTQIQDDERLLGSYDSFEAMKEGYEQLKKAHPCYVLDVYAPFVFVKK
jgi:hypothetical protein